MKELRIRWQVILLLAVVSAVTGHACAQGQSPATQPSLDSRFRRGEILFVDEFRDGLAKWSVELERGAGAVNASDGKLQIDVPGGCTIWMKAMMEGPLLIEYQATLIRAGGANDRVSDLNCFWMARDSRSPYDLFKTQRSGAFGDYNRLLCYYVGLGGNGNTTTRFRRYIGDDVQRPLLPENDLHEPADLLVSNAVQTISLVADGSLIQFYRNGKRVFEMNDLKPYASGWFGFRTTQNHMNIEHFRVYRLLAARGPATTQP